MLPAWLSRRRDTQKLKQKQAGGPLLLPYFNASQQRLDDVEPPAASFAQALSLHKAISRTRDSYLEAELAEFVASRKDPDGRHLSYSPRDDSQYASAINYSHHSQGERTAAVRTSTVTHSHTSAQHDALSSFKYNVVTSSMLCPSSGSGEPAVLATDGAAPIEKSHSLTSNGHVKVFPRDIRKLVSCLQSGANDNDTEESTILTSDSIESSFGSESSSVGSSMVRKCGITEESRQCLSQWSEEVFPFELEDIEGVNVEASTGPCYLDQIQGFAEWQEQQMSELVECADCSLRIDMPSPASNLDQALESLKHHGNSSSGVAGSSSLLNQDIHHQQGFCTLRSPSVCGSDSGCGIGLENSPSLVISSGPTPRESEVANFEVFLEHKSLITSNMELECNLVPGNSNSEGAKFGRILYSRWEESSALIAAKNPSLMLSSKWQEERNGSCSSVQSNHAESPESNACQDGKCKLLMHEGQHQSNASLTSELEDLCNDLPVCGLQNEGKTGCHRSKHYACIRNGRRHRGSSFSAALPENLQGAVGDSVALVKMSNSPYEDFRQSMYEMIMDQDLEEAPMDVEELLHCYLTLNSPELHPLIKEVFSDVWSSILMDVR